MPPPSLGFDDAMWEKYGQFFSRVTRITALNSDEPPSMNPMNIEVSSYSNRGNTLEIIRNRGIQYAVCSKATQSMSNLIASNTGAAAEDIFQELTQHNIRTSRFVPAGVVATTRSQEYGFSLAVCGVV
jgi:intracellular sulfur oxidation DsrE/DsrF family protein